jgi:3-hydroxyisobutyrate dehydrogenase-like beta-hydroxyacid dehydrogenase
MAIGLLGLGIMGIRMEDNLLGDLGSSVICRFIHHPSGQE